MTFLTRMLQQIKVALGVKPKPVPPPCITRPIVRYFMNGLKEATNKAGEVLTNSAREWMEQQYRNSPEK